MNKTATGGPHETSERRPYPLRSRALTVDSAAQTYLSDIRTVRSTPRSASALASGTARLWTTLIAVPLTRHGKALGNAQKRSLVDASRKLFENKKGRRWLEGERLSMHTAAHFHLGLSNTQATQQIDALVFPLMDAAGSPKKRRIYLDIPNVTKHLTHWRDTWALGAASTYWVTPAGDQRTVIICHRIELGWRLWQLLGAETTPPDVCLIASTPGDMPAEWRSPDFWSAWDTVYFACDSESQWATLSGAREGFGSRIVRTLLPPGGQSWRSFFLAGGTAADFRRSLVEATHVFPQGMTTPALAPELLDVNMSFSGGNLYYPFYRTEYSVPSSLDAGHLVPTTHVAVLRSDGVVLTATPAPQPHSPGMPAAYLDDGTLLERLPAPLASALTFKPETISAFQAGRLSGRTAMSQSDAELLTGVRTFLALAAPTMADDQLVLLAYAVFLSYVQAVFPFVPLIQIRHVDDSSVLAHALYHLGCNAVLFHRHVQPEALAATLNALGGLVILHNYPSTYNNPDVLESDRVLSLLSSSFQRSSARHILAGAPGEPPIVVKTSGLNVLFSSDQVPAHLHDRKLLLSAERPRVPRPSPAPSDVPDSVTLRSDLHVWAMERAAALHTLSLQAEELHPDLLTFPRTSALMVIARSIGDVEAERRFIMLLKRTCEVGVRLPERGKKPKS